MPDYRLVWFRNSWALYWFDGEGSRRISLRTKDRATAEQALKDANTPARPTITTVGEAMAAYLAEKQAIASLDRVEFAWKRLKPVFAHLRPDQIDRPLCRAYAARRHRDGVQAGTILKELSVLRAALLFVDPRSPAVFDLPPAPLPKAGYLTREQYRALRDAAAGTPHLWLFIVVAYATAGRAAAVLQLTWGRVNFSTGRIALGDDALQRTKKGRATVPMTAAVREALTRAKEGALSGYVIEYAGRPVGSVKKAFARAAVRAGVPWCTPHVLRHTAAVHMIEDGVRIEEVSQYLGHSSTRVTERVYAKFSPEFLQRAANALE